MTNLTLPGNLGTLDFSDWLYGLFAAFIGGGAGAVSGGVAVNLVDPKDFNIHTTAFYHVVLTAFVCQGLMSAMLYLHQKPLPAFRNVETVTKTTLVTPGTPPATVVTTTTESHQEPAPKEEK